MHSFRAERFSAPSQIVDSFQEDCMLKLIRRMLQDKKGAALVEYALVVAGVALIGAASVSTFGHKTNDMIAMAAAVLPGAHAGDNGPLASGHLIETTAATTATVPIAVDITAITTATNTDRLDKNLGTGTASTLVLEP
jgi:Flp pilus assembly pilin Flp